MIRMIKPVLIMAIFRNDTGAMPKNIFVTKPDCNSVTRKSDKWFSRHIALVVKFLLSFILISVMSISMPRLVLPGFDSWNQIASYADALWARHEPKGCLRKEARNRSLMFFFLELRNTTLSTQSKYTVHA